MARSVPALSGRRAELPSPRRVLVALGRCGGYLDRIGRGIVAYARQTGGWEVLGNSRAPEVMLEEQSWMLREAEGVIASGLDSDWDPRLRGLGKPVVLVEQSAVGLPVVLPDNQAVGRLAAQYFLTLGFVHFGFWGMIGSEYADHRLAGFAAALATTGHAVCAEPTNPTTTPGGYNHGKLPRLSAWLGSLPRPVAIFCDNVNQARDVAHACLEAGIRVPDEVAILGVDDDEVYCELTTPPLSTIDQGCEETGYRAAALLDAMMAGAPWPAEPILIRPRGVVERQSTDTLAITDPEVAAVVRMIRQRAVAGLSVEEILRQVPVSRRSLEMRFRRILGRTLQDEITRVRLAHARTLLTTTTLSLYDISIRSGFASANRLSKVFRRVEGTTVRDFRHINGQPRPPGGALGAENTSS